MIDHLQRQAVDAQISNGGQPADLLRQIDLNADVEEAERKRREIAALQMFAFVGAQSPGAGSVPVAGDGFLLVPRQLSRLDLDDVTAALQQRRRTALAELEPQRIAVHVDGVGERRIHVGVPAARNKGSGVGASLAVARPARRGKDAAGHRNRVIRHEENARHSALAFAARHPQRAEPLAERLRLFREQAAGKAAGVLQMRGAAVLDHRREPRAPGRQQPMRRGEARQNRQILAGAELVAQALRLLHPQLGEARPQRLDQLHLVAVLDHAPAQVVQMVGVGLRPMVRHQLTRAPIGGGEPVGNAVEVDCGERPVLQRQCGIVEIAGDLLAQRGREGRRLLSVAQRGQARADGLRRGGRERQLRLVQILERIEGCLGVARAGEQAHEIARFGAHLIDRGAARAGEQAQQRPPALEGLAHVVHGVGFGQLGVGQGGAGIGNDGACGCGQAVTETPVAVPSHPRHGRFFARIRDRLMKNRGFRPSHRDLPLLHSR